MALSLKSGAKIRSYFETSKRFGEKSARPAIIRGTSGLISGQPVPKRAPAGKSFSCGATYYGIFPNFDRRRDDRSRPSSGKTSLDFNDLSTIMRDGGSSMDDDIMALYDEAAEQPGAAPTATEETVAVTGNPVAVTEIPVTTTENPGSASATTKKPSPLRERIARVNELINRFMSD